MTTEHYFASTRAAAGVSMEEWGVRDVSALMCGAAERHGTRMAAIMDVASLLVDGSVARDRPNRWQGPWRCTSCRPLQEAEMTIRTPPAPNIRLDGSLGLSRLARVRTDSRGRSRRGLHRGGAQPRRRPSRGPPGVLGTSGRHRRSSGDLPTSCGRSTPSFRC
jgi:hypothetical protein